MRVFRNSLLILLSLTLFLVFPAITILQSFGSTIGKPYTFIRYLEKSAVNLEIERYVKEKFITESAALDNEGSKKIISNAVLRLTSDQLSKEWLISKLAVAERAVWDYLLAKKATVQPISITELHKSFAQNTEEEIDKYLNDADLPAELIKADLQQQFAAIIPPNIDLLGLFGLDLADLDKLSFYLSQSKKLLLLLYLAMVFIVIFGMIAAGKLQLALKWVGLTAIFASIIVLTLAGAVTIIPETVIISRFELTGVLGEFTDSLLVVANLVMDDLAKSLAKFAGLSMVAGVIGLLGGLSLKKS